ncbi:Rho-type gtpase-activating protein [Rhizina undulata]
MDSPTPGSPIEEDDGAYPCKGCGNVLEEGKAFELAGSRWHIDCFRCNECSTLLDSDANLLLLGDGSLICNNCTYSCVACHNKIEDLAILTGDQAFCAGCFRCRNCKRKIENLKYARTSQGIFCMSCHETLMARRRKRNKVQQQKTPTIGSNSASPMLSLDKSLPSLPVEEDEPPAADPHPDAPTELSPRPRPANSRSNSSKSGPTPDQLSPLGVPSADHHLRTPRTHNKRYSYTSQLSEVSYDSQPNTSGYEPYHIPVVLDPSLSHTPSPLPSTAYKPPGKDQPRPHDSPFNYNDRLGREQQSNARSSYERKPSDVYESERAKNTRPHIASQDKSRQVSASADLGRKSNDTDRKFERPATNSNSHVNIPRDTPRPETAVDSADRENFKLGEVPRQRKKSLGTPRPSDFEEGLQLPHELSLSLSPINLDGLPAMFIPESSARGDSFRPSPGRLGSPVSNKRSLESPVNSTSSGRSQKSHGPSGSNASAITSADSPEAAVDAEPHGLRISTRNTLPTRPATSHGIPTHSSFSPNSDSVTSEMSPMLPPPFETPVGDLSLGIDIARVFGAGDDSGSLLRKASNAVRHGRSFSDLAARTTESPKWPRSPSVGNATYIPTFAEDLNSPKDENSALKVELRRAMQKIAELEARLSNSASVKALDSNILEKRQTVALLETEREEFLRELMVIKERMDANKDGKPVNVDELKTDLIRGLTRELEDLKASLRSQIHAYVAERDRLADEVESFARAREQAIQETEQLNLKNAQLADLNNELTRRIQGQFKANKTQVNGLGIYTGNAADLLEVKDLDKRPATAVTPGGGSITNINAPMQDPVNDGGEVFIAQKVSTVKNGQGAKKTFWKKGGASIMKGAGKGFNKVFAMEQQKDGYQGDTANGVDSPNVPRVGVSGPDAVGPGKLFGTQKKWIKGGKGGSTAGMNGAASNNSINASELPLFGIELELRAEYEGNRIPNVVLRCIQEVEVRGMDFEGIYRKSGGASQMRQIQEAFERGEDPQFDSSIDICGVTSVLKQYFRNLPTPLLTYDIYERFVETSTVFEEEKRVKAVKDLIDELPSIHRDCLQFVIFHLARVAARKEENLMNTRNLAVVFAPTLLRHTSDEREMSDMHAKNNAIQFLIDNNELIF